MAIDRMEEDIEQKLAKQTMDVKKDAYRLIKTKETIDRLKDEMELLKQKLLPVAKRQNIETSDGSIVFVEGSVGEYWNKDKMKQVLINTLKISEIMADKIISAGASKKIIESYIKVLTK